MAGKIQAGFFDKHVDETERRLAPDDGVLKTVQDWEKRSKHYLSNNIRDMIVAINPAGAIAFCAWLRGCDMTETDSDVTFYCPTVNWAELAQGHLEKNMAHHFRTKTIRWCGREWQNKSPCLRIQATTIRGLQKTPPEEYHRQLQEAARLCTCYSCAGSARQAAALAQPAPDGYDVLQDDDQVRL